MNGMIDISLGRTSHDDCRAFRWFLSSFDADALALLRFLIERTDSITSIIPVSVQEEELLVTVKNEEEVQLNELIDKFISDHNLTSRTEAIRVLLLNNGISWQSKEELRVNSGHRNSILQRLNEDRKGSSKFCDMKLMIGENESYNVHKCILAAASEFFADLFQTNSNILKISNIPSPGYLEIVLDFLYTGEITINKENCKPICEVATILQVSCLRKVCEDCHKLIYKRCETKEQENEISDGDTNALICKENSKKPNVTTYIIDGNKNDDFLSDHEIDDTNAQFDSGEKDKSVLDMTNQGNIEDTGPYKCTYCQEMFEKRCLLAMHSINHMSMPPYTCHSCNDSFHTKDQLKNHIEEIHIEKFLCDHCPEVFIDNHSLMEHLRKEHRISGPKQKSITKKQSVVQNSSANSKTKKKKERKPNRYSCPKCKSWFQNKSHLNRHMISHTGERKHCCTTCGKLFLKPDHLTRHEKTHSAERPFECDQCDKRFKTKDNLKRHYLTHTNERPFFCELCAKQFKDRSGLQIHQRSHGDSDRVCPHCGKCFKQKNRLAYHIARHNNPLLCTICGKEFPFQNHLRRHMLLHAGVRPFNCETCGKQFSNVHGLKVHQKKHTGIGLHSCTVCGRKFLDNFHLQRHMKIHTGEKPFKCDFCNHSFSRADNCEIHKRSCEIKMELRKNMEAFTEENATLNGTKNEKVKLKQESSTSTNSKKRGKATRTSHTSAQQNELKDTSLSQIAITLNANDITSCLYKKNMTKRVKFPDFKLVMLSKDQPTFEQITVMPSTSADNHLNPQNGVVGIADFAQEKSISFEENSRFQTLDNDWTRQFTSDQS